MLISLTTAILVLVIIVYSVIKFACAVIKDIKNFWLYKYFTSFKKVKSTKYFKEVRV